MEDKCDFVVDGNIFYEGRIVKACVGITDGKIHAIKKIIKGEKYKDFGYRLIIPAGIDAHVHFREPGLVKKEDFYNGSLCAALGGISCILDMPNTKPPVVTVGDLEDKISIAKRRSHVDFGFFAFATNSMSTASIESLSKFAIGFKIFMAGASEEFVVKEETELQRIIGTIAKTRKIISVHAEDDDIIEERKKEIASKGYRGLEDHNRIRNEDAEVSAIKKILKVKSTGRIHFAHVSSRKTVELLRNIKEKEPSVLSNISSEVTPHHLFLTEKFSMPSRPSKPGFGKVNPPLRKPEDRVALYDALLDGTVDIVASDHAPHTIEEKEDDFER
ncbi:MAG: amidohydrolase family protein, partial [Thermoplasmata archaeon]